MGRGRKANAIKELNYNTIFYNSVGSYVQRINVYLSHSIESEPLSNHIKIAGGFAFKSADYVSNGIPIIRISDFGDERIILKSVKFYKESEQLKKYELKGGDIIIALTGGTIAKLGIVQKGIGKLYLNQRVGKFEILDPAIFENEYVYWIARSVQTIIKELAWGAAIPNVSPKQIEKIRFPIPDRQTQKGIILFLNDLKNNSIIKGKGYFHSETEAEILLIHENSLRSAGIVTELSHQQSLLKKLRQQILQDAIEGKLTKDWREQNPDVEPASELLKHIQAEKQQLIKDKKIKKQKTLPVITEDEKPFELPDRWEWIRLGGLCSKTGSGSTPSGGKSAYIDNGIKFIRSQNVYNNGFRWNGEAYIPKYTHEKMKGTKLLPQDLLLNITGGSIGRCCILPLNFDEGNINQHVAIIRLILTNTGGYIHKVICSSYFQNEIINVQTGAGREGLPKNRMDNMLIPCPPLIEIKAIITKVEKLFVICDQLEGQITSSQANTEQLMQSVLKEAFSQSNAA